FNTGANAVETGSTEPGVDYDALLEENLDLQRTIADLQVELVRLQEIERAYERVSAIANYNSDNLDLEVVSADVIARDTSGYLRWVGINRGTRDGIQVGDAVMGGAEGSGFVGVVGRVSATTAWVRLVIDPDTALNALVQESRAEGTVLGQIRGGLIMDFIPQEFTVEVGDTVITSGLGGSLPAGLVIGEVQSVQRQEAELFQQAAIRPMVDFDQLEIVAVVTSFQPVDTTIFDEALEEEGAEDAP
ncbi:MAG: rod shape-determining protein MreC, partial [Anaerolineae bacterium]